MGNHFEVSEETQSDFFVSNRLIIWGRDYCHLDSGGDSSNRNGYTLKVFSWQNGQVGVALPIAQGVLSKIDSGSSL